MNGVANIGRLPSQNKSIKEYWHEISKLRELCKKHPLYMAMYIAILNQFNLCAREKAQDGYHFDRGISMTPSAPWSKRLMWGLPWPNQGGLPLLARTALLCASRHNFWDWCHAAQTCNHSQSDVRTHASRTVEVRSKQGCQVRPPVMAAASVFASLKPKLAWITEVETNYLHCASPPNVPVYD